MVAARYMVWHFMSMTSITVKKSYNWARDTCKPVDADAAAVH
jgi:hypothetical protein